MVWKKSGKLADRPLEAVERMGVLIGCVLLWGMFGLVLLQMFSRVLLSTGLPWPDELARYFHIVLVFFGLAFAHRMRNHVDMLFFAERWSPVTQRIAGAVIELSIVVSSVVIVAGGISLISRMGSQKGPSLGLPLTYFIGVTVVGFALLALEALRQLVRKFSSSDAVALPDKKEHLEL
ncbi:TRAP transporter small permease [Arvimicrobium flavum]|uniref:TRAP transporter small permease n=1 Tax=Arvimicrobium flavum TaxID=3393320 RepID=UPI00237B7B85|nr:TRAP transporter small permease [Mesorhizobium shangrilense]